MNPRRLAVIALMALAPSAFADQYAAFHNAADSGSLKPFCRDLGGIIGSTTFHDGGTLGTLVVDAGVRGSMQFAADKNDTVLRRSGRSSFGFPWLQAEVGLPASIDVFVRGNSNEGLKVLGGGLRWGLLKSHGIPFAPQVLVAGSANTVTGPDFTATHFGANVVGSMGIALITPFVGAGFDSTRVRVSSALPNLAQGTTATTVGSRFTAGAQIMPWKHLALTAAFVLRHGQSGAEAGLTLRF